MSTTVTFEVQNEVLRTGRFVIDPMIQRRFGGSKEIYVGGGSRINQLVREAKSLGVNMIVFGRIVEARIKQNADEVGLLRESRSFMNVKLEVRVYEISSNKEVLNEQINGYAEDKRYRFFQGDEAARLAYRRELLRYASKVAVRRAIPRIIELSSKLDWVGRVAKILGSKVYINAGRDSGLRIGDILKVMTEGAEIYDPDTGGLIGVSKGQVKGTLEVVDYFGPDGAICILHSGGAVQEADFVQLY